MCENYRVSSAAADRFRTLSRLHGTRLANAEKNVGRPAFAFNALQLQMLPRLYRPPVVVTGNAQT